MKLRLTLIFSMIVLFGSQVTAVTEDIAPGGDGDQLRQSLVYLDITSCAYENMQPWKKAATSSSYGYGCAVGPYQVLTTAWNITDATYIKARRFGKNEFIPASISVVDYEMDLALIELDKGAMEKPLIPLEFADEYSKGGSVKSFWLSAGGHLTTGRGYIDRADVYKSPASYTFMLNYIIGNTSNSDSRGRIYLLDDRPVGIACWSDADTKETGLIPAETINRFLADTHDGDYRGFAATGFSVSKLIDPAMRNFLKMPAEVSHGVYIDNVYTVGTGSDLLRKGDVLLSINGFKINAYGRYEDPRYDRIQFDHILAATPVDALLEFEIWRDGEGLFLETRARKFTADDMLIPWYEYGKQPEYCVKAGFIFQKLTRPYMHMWGDDFDGKIPPHIYQYYRDLSFKASEDREDVVILSFVMPHQVNLGYHSLQGEIVKSVNGKQIISMDDFVDALKLSSEADYDVIEFENDNPTLVISREQARIADPMIAERFGVTMQMNVN